MMQPKVQSTEKLIVDSSGTNRHIVQIVTALDAQVENEQAFLEDWRQLKEGPITADVCVDRSGQAQEHTGSIVSPLFGASVSKCY